MKILHISPHMGGGVGTVIMGWQTKLEVKQTVMCLDWANHKAIATLKGHLIGDASAMDKKHPFIHDVIRNNDIVLVHYWDHRMLADLLADPLPPCRLVFWCHKNIPYSQAALDYPDLWIDTSPIQGRGRHIWSTGGIDRFLQIQPKAHEGFNVGYVGTIDFKKIHPDFQHICDHLIESIPNIHFIMVGEPHFSLRPSSFFTFTGKVDDVAPYLAEMDVFGYPLRPDHYGTSEQVLGEAMAAGVVPVVMDNPAERRIIKFCHDGLTATNEQEYVHSIYSLYLDKKVRGKMSNSARKKAAELYSLDTMIDKWNAVFDETMSKPKRDRGTLCP